MKQPVELLYLSLMLRWEGTAPLDGHQGSLDGDPERNTQISRMAYVLSKIAAGSEDRVFKSLERSTRRRDGRSYISKDAAWMEQPTDLLAGWCLEGCTSLVQKHAVLDHLLQLGLSRAFIACAKDFVEGKSLEKHLPSEQQQEEIVRKYEEQQGRAG